MIQQPGCKQVYSASPTALNLRYTQHWAAVRARPGGWRQQENEASIYDRLLFFKLKLFFFAKALLFERGRKIKEKTRPGKSLNFRAHLPPHPHFCPRKPAAWPLEDLQHQSQPLSRLPISKPQFWEPVWWKSATTLHSTTERRDWVNNFGSQMQNLKPKKKNDFFLRRC